MGAGSDPGVPLPGHRSADGHAPSPMPGVMMGSGAHQSLVDFAASSMLPWRCIDDVVMGGISRSSVRFSGEGTGIFAGVVSLARGGGFASARAEIGPLDLSAHAGLGIRVRGDGKRYRLRIHTDSGMDAVAYQAGFDTLADAWREVFLPFAVFEPTFRGRRPTGARPLEPRHVRQLGIMIADRQPGPFRLEVAWIRAGIQGDSATLGQPRT